MLFNSDTDFSIELGRLGEEPEDDAVGVGAANLQAAPYRLCTFSCSHTLISD